MSAGFANAIDYLGGFVSVRLRVLTIKFVFAVLVFGAARLRRWLSPARWSPAVPPGTSSRSGTGRVP